MHREVPKMAMIVIAEDEFLIADMLAMYLEDAGHEPIVHPNGEAAFEYIRDNRRSPDNRFHTRMTGWSLQQLYDPTPRNAIFLIILVSGAQTSSVVLTQHYSTSFSTNHISGKLLKIAEDLIREGRPTLRITLVAVSTSFPLHQL